MGINEDVASNEYVLDENESNTVENFDFDDSTGSRTDDYALNEEGLEDYGSDDYSSDDYGSDDYSSGLEDLGC
jgi:hypothetical protein